MSEEMNTLVVDLVLLRREYKEKKWWKAADVTRTFLEALEIEVRDSKDGQMLRHKDSSRWVTIQNQST
jgi:cysteinyl-tRNA synthetase